MCGGPLTGAHLKCNRLFPCVRRISQDLAKDLAVLAREIHDVAGEIDSVSSSGTAPSTTLSTAATTPGSAIDTREEVRGQVGGPLCLSVLLPCLSLFLSLTPSLTWVAFSVFLRFSMLSFLSLFHSVSLFLSLFFLIPSSSLQTRGKFCGPPILQVSKFSFSSCYYVSLFLSLSPSPSHPSFMYSSERVCLVSCFSL